MASILIECGATIRFPIKSLFRLTVFAAALALVARENWYGSPGTKLIAHAILVGLALWFAYKAASKKAIIAKESEPEKRPD